MNRFLQVVADGSRIGHGYGVFRQRLDHRDDIDFLRSALTDSQRRSIGGKHSIRALYLSGEKETRGGVEKRSGQSGDRVGSARAGSDHGNAKQVGRLGVVLSRDGRGLLMMVANEF